MIRSLFLCIFATTVSTASAHAFDFLPLNLFPKVKFNDSKKLQWTRIEVPGAQCANGDTYPIFINQDSLNKSRKKRSEKVMFILQGGGVCFDKYTCQGINLAAPDKVIPYDGDLGSIDGEGLFTSDEQFNKFRHYSKVYLPYCTGDVFLGRHTANYDGLTVRHHGQANIEKAITHIKNSAQLFEFTQTQEVVLYGFSAGAIGALNHINTFQHHFPNAHRKALISDAPGLHFSETFWHSFSNMFLNDVRKAFRRYNFTLDRDNGLIAGIVPRICRKHRDWNIGVLQAALDVAMIFYGQHQDERDHERMVLSSQGIAQITEDPTDNCSSWVEAGNDSYGLPGQEPGAANSFNHTYMISNDTTVIRLNGVSAMGYALNITRGTPVANSLAITDRPDHAQGSRRVVSTSK